MEEVEEMEKTQRMKETKRMEETQRKELMNLTTRLKDMEEKWEMLYQQHQQVDILDPKSRLHKPYLLLNPICRSE